MANPHKGEIEFESDGKRYTLSLSVNALCELDQALGVEDAVTELMLAGKMKVPHYRTLFFLAIKHHHPELTDEKQAADLVGLRQMIDLLGQATKAAFPSVDADAKENPPKPDRAGRPGTGLGSGSPGAA
jgi:hypothetical protein